jgi:hypothetical protein
MHQVTQGRNAMKSGDEVVVSGKGLKTYGFDGKIQQIRNDKALVAIEGMNPTWIALKNLSSRNGDISQSLVDATKKHNLFVFIPGHDDTLKKARAGRDITDALENAYVIAAPTLEAAIEKDMETIEDWLDDEACVLVYDGERYHEIRRGKVEVKPL